MSEKPAAPGGTDDEIEEGAFYDETVQEISEEDERTAAERWLEFEAAIDDLMAAVPDEPDFPVLDGDGPDIPKKPGVRLDQLHPDLTDRLARALADPRLAEIARVSSGVRTYAQQKYLRKKYGPGRAANPDYVGPDGRRGSKHMVQAADWSYAGVFPAGEFGYAVDVGFWKGAPTRAERDHLRDVMAEYGLRLTVFRPYEWWHFELDPAMAPGAEVAASGVGAFDEQEHPEMQLISDPESGRQWAAWPGPGGVQHVREYSSPRENVGTAMPGIGVVIDEQVDKGNIAKG